MANEQTLIIRLIADDTAVHQTFTKTSRGAKNLDKDLSKATRGFLAGSGAARSFGRSLAFASGGFLAFSGGAAFLRKSVDAAKEAQVANAQLATQLRNSGKSFAQYRSQIDATVNRLSALAGIEDDELKAGLTTILRTVPNVGKALRDLGTAADLARAKHISLGAAATIIAKTEAGNTTLLRRQGFQIAKNATAEQALAVLRQKVAGQAAAGTTEQERFGAVLHQTEEIIGTALLPTINKYLRSGTRWLEQMNQSGKLQKDVASAAHNVETAVGAAADVIKTADKVTGSFKHTLELLLALKVATKLGSIAENLGLIGSKAAGADGKVKRLKASMAGLNQVTIAAITIPIVYEITTKILDKTGGTKLLKKAGGSVFDQIFGSGNNAVPVTGKAVQAANRFARAELDAGKSVQQVTLDLIESQKFGKLSKTEIDAVVRVASQAKTQLQGVQVSMEQVVAGAEAVTKAVTVTKTAKKSGGLTASQRNTFFDNDISRLLFRGGLGDLRSQLSADNKVAALLEERIRVTKDITRKQNLQDQLLQVLSDRRGVLQQIKSNADATRQAAKEAAAALKQSRLDATTAKEFRQLGLTATGEEITPGKSNLRKRISQITQNISGTKLDTPKLRSELKRFQKVLSEGLVPQDVRAKIKDLLDGISQEIKDAGKTQQKDLTKFKHVSADALISGLGLDPETARILKQRLAQVGQGGTVPAKRSAAFSGAGAGAGSHTTVIQLDGKEIARSTTKHQRQNDTRRAVSRSGPYAGRH